MTFPVLQEYLSRLYSTPGANTRVWADAEGRAFGRFFHSTLTSVFQPIRCLGDGTVIGYEGYARSHSDSDTGLSLWRLLDHAASDDESVELDRLCRMLHAINFFRQAAAGESDLYLNVHARLLAAIDGNHGVAFGHVLKVLGLPRDRIVLQLPVVVEHQDWLLGYVADNYRRNGFRLALNAANIGEAIVLAEKHRPEAVKVDTRYGLDDGPAIRLLELCAGIGVRVIFKRVDNSDTVDFLQRIAAVSGQAVHAQGFWWNCPSAEVVAYRSRSAADLPLGSGAAQQGRRRQA